MQDAKKAIRLCYTKMHDSLPCGAGRGNEAPVPVLELAVGSPEAAEGIRMCSIVHPRGSLLRDLRKP